MISPYDVVKDLFLVGKALMDQYGKYEEIKPKLVLLRDDIDVLSHMLKTDEETKRSDSKLCENISKFIKKCHHINTKLSQQHKSTGGKLVNGVRQYIAADDIISSFDELHKQMGEFITQYQLALTKQISSHTKESVEQSKKTNEILTGMSSSLPDCVKNPIARAFWDSNFRNEHEIK